MFYVLIGLGLRQTSRYLTAGNVDFDRLLLRPIHTKVQLMENKVDLRLLNKYKDHRCCVLVVAVKASNLSR